MSPSEAPLVAQAEAWILAQPDPAETALMVATTALRIHRGLAGPAATVEAGRAALDEIASEGGL